MQERACPKASRSSRPYLLAVPCLSRLSCPSRQHSAPLRSVRTLGRVAERIAGPEVKQHTGHDYGEHDCNQKENTAQSDRANHDVSQSALLGLYDFDDDWRVWRILESEKCEV